MQSSIEAAQHSIIQSLNTLEKQDFMMDRWERPGGGGGVTAVIEKGSVFDKGGVNTSAVHGTITEKERPMFQQLLSHQGLEMPSISEPSFFATGVSLVLHPKNPFAPTVHANYRYFELETGAEPIWWFGGGTDLTPYYLFEEDAQHFHRTLKDCCDGFDSDYYPKFKARCDEYFHLPHRGETRGIGGIFYDYLNDSPQERLLEFSQACADSFIPAYLPILEKRHKQTYTEAHQEWQQIRRGRYVEFNLLYDRGTLFGLKTNGRIESILMSLPNTANWAYNHHPEQGSEESKLLDTLQSPREWA
jgi:coproporphyrinogen III oxidase